MTSDKFNHLCGAMDILVTNYKGLNVEYEIPQSSI